MMFVTMCTCALYYIELTIGLQHTLYSVSELDGSLEVCAEVLEGSHLATEAVLVNYFTTHGDAVGQYCVSESFN